MNCAICNQPATWQRITQFAGKHPYCFEHAKQEPDFLAEDDSTGWQWLGEPWSAVARLANKQYYENLAKKHQLLAQQFETRALWF